MTDAAPALDELWQRVEDRAAALEVTDVGRPSPCAGWTVGDVLRHIAHQAELDGGPILPLPAGWSPPDGVGPRDVWTEAGVAARAGRGLIELREDLSEARRLHLDRVRRRDWSVPAVAPPGLPAGTEAFHTTTRAFDLWVHLADLVVAMGGSWPGPDEDLSAGAALAQSKVVDLLPFLLEHRAGLAPRTGLRVRLGPPLGIDTVVGGSDEAGLAEGDPAALALFVAGRAPLTDFAGRLRLDGVAGDALARHGVVFAPQQEAEGVRVPGSS